MNDYQGQPNLIGEVRRLAGSLGAGAISHCLERVLEGQDNPCFEASSKEKELNVLAKAEFVAGQVQQGLSLPDALRELGRRMRLLDHKDITK